MSFRIDESESEMWMCLFELVKRKKLPWVVLYNLTVLMVTIGQPKVAWSVQAIGQAGEPRLDIRLYSGRT